MPGLFDGHTVDMARSYPTGRRWAACVLAAALLITAPGPGAVQALAAVRIAVSAGKAPLGGAAVGAALKTPVLNSDPVLGGLALSLRPAWPSSGLRLNLGNTDASGIEALSEVSVEPGSIEGVSAAETRFTEEIISTAEGSAAVGSLKERRQAFAEVLRAAASERRDRILDESQIASHLADIGRDKEMAAAFSEREDERSASRKRASGRVRRLARTILKRLGGERFEERLRIPERHAIRLYALTFSGRMNAALRDGSAALGGETSPAYLSLAALAVSGLNRLPDFRGRVRREVFMNADKASGFAERFTEGQVVMEKGFLSASLPYGEPYGAMRGGMRDELFLFTITSKTGKSIERISRVPGEHEVLFRPGTPFLVVEHEVLQSKGGRKEHYIRLVEFDGKPVLPESALKKRVRVGYRRFLGRKPI